MHKSRYICGDEAMKKEYKKYANKLTKIKLAAKQKYYANELVKNKSNTKNVGAFVIAAPGGKSSKSHNLPSSVSVNGTNISNEHLIMEEFNKFFTNIVKFNKCTKL